MATNPYFDNFQNSSEQGLIEDLIIESIKIYGHDVTYCPRTVVSRDEILNEDTTSKYEDSYNVEMYIKNVEGFEGEGDFLSRFNIQIRDEITFTIANRRYVQQIGDDQDSERPREGDLIYMPLTEKVYVVKFVEHEAVFYQMGSLQMYDLRCELWEYSGEDLNTGIAAIDDLETTYTLVADADDGVTYYANGDVIIDANTGRPAGVADSWYTENDAFDDASSFQYKADEFIDFSEADPFSDDGRY